MHLNSPIDYYATFFFQDVDEARKYMAFFYPSMGQPLPEKNYAEDCRLYTPGHPDGDFQVIMDKIDFYVPAHFIGWVVKVLSEWEDVKISLWSWTNVSLVFKYLLQVAMKEKALILLEF